MYCQKCGFENQEGVKFCKQCGEPTGGGATAAAASTTATKTSGFFKTKDGKVLSGVCAGLGKKWNMNPWIIRGVLIILNFFGIGFFLDIIYILMIFALKYDDEI